MFPAHAFLRAFPDTNSSKHKKVQAQEFSTRLTYTNAFPIPCIISIQMLRTHLQSCRHPCCLASCRQSTAQTPSAWCMRQGQLLGVLSSLLRHQHGRGGGCSQSVLCGHLYWPEGGRAQLLPALPGLYVRQVEKGSTAEQAFAMMQKMTTFFTHSLC